MIKRRGPNAEGLLVDGGPEGLGQGERDLAGPLQAEQELPVLPRGAEGGGGHAHAAEGGGDVHPDDGALVFGGLEKVQYPVGQLELEHCWSVTT